MTSKNNQNNNGFSSLSIYRVADEEIGRLKNDRIHYTYLNGPKNVKNDSKNKYKDSYQIRQINLNEKKAKEKERNYRTKSAIKEQHYSFIASDGEGKQKLYSKKDILRTSNASKEKDRHSFNKRNINTYKAKVKKKRNIEHIDRIIIDLVNDYDDDNCNDNDTIKTESNYCKKEKFFKKYMSNINSEKNINYEKLIKKENTLSNNNDIQSALNMIENRWKNICVESKELNIPLLSDNGINYAINMIENRWKNNCIESKELNIPLLSNEISMKKNEIENIIENRNNIVKEIYFSFIKENNIGKKEDNNNINDKWNNNIKKENNQFFSIIKEVNKDYFLYSENNYIKDLIKNINIPPNNISTFYILNNDDFINKTNKLDYKVVKSNNKNQLESDLYNFYQNNKINYLKNKDNNEELNINPIYILNDKQLKQLYEELNIDNKLKEKDEFIIPQLSIAKQIAIDYEIIEVNTPKTGKIDTSSNNPISKRSSAFTKDLKSEKVSELNFEREKKSSSEFGQYTPISMLNDKFCVYAVSRNVKYSIPQRQGFVSYLSYSKGDFNYDALKKNNFDLTMEWSEKEKVKEKESFKFSKKSTKRNNDSIDKKNEAGIIDYSKISGNSLKNSYKNSFKNSKIK
jgi:hypothetical protein